MQGGPGADILMGMLVCFAIFFVAILIVTILFLLTLYRTQQAVNERNRDIAPGMVWLTLIPLFGTIWAPIMVPKLANSLRREFADRGWGTEGEGFAQTTGLLWAWGGIVNTVLSVVRAVAEASDMQPVAMALGLLGLPLGLGILVCWIIYWVQMAQYGKRLREDQWRHAPGSIEEDYDDMPRRPRDDDFDQPRRDREE